MNSRSQQQEFLWPAVVIFFINVALLGPLFAAERLVYHGSIEGAFIGLARFFSRHPDPFGWYPLWYGGTPVQFTYTPGLHYINALFIWLLPGLEPGQVYHAVSAVMYALGSVTAAYLAYFFTRARWWAFGAGMLYSLWSPAIWLIREVRADSAGFQAPWRLQVLAKYGEGPHIASLMLVPLAICALWRAAHRKDFPPLFLAASLLAAIVLINWVGAFALGAVCFCFLLTVAARNPGFGPVGRTSHVFAAAALACLLAAFWITPTFIRTIAFNAQIVSGHYEYRWGMIGLLAGAVIGLLVIRWIFLAFPEQSYLCFLSLNSFFFGYLVLSAYWFQRFMIPQPHRYVPEFELFSILLGCEVFRLAFRHSAGRRRRIVVAATTAMALLALWQARHFLTGSYRMLRPAPVAQWVEYKLARWLHENSKPEDRVFIVGSEGMSLNGWFDVAQVKGWFDPGVRDQLVLGLGFQITSSMNTPEDRDGAIGIQLLKALGARYVVVHTTNSKVAYHDFLRPKKFEGLLPAVYRPTSEEVIYEIPGAHLAHLVRPEELPSRRPVNGLDIQPLARYLAALDDPARPVLETRWKTPNELEIRGDFPPGLLVSLQVSHAPGWQVFQGGEKVPFERDQLGFLALHPFAEQEGRLRLRYVGSLEQRFCGWISFVTLGAALAISFSRRSRRAAGPTI